MKQYLHSIIYFLIKYLIHKDLPHLKKFNLHHSKNKNFKFKDILKY